VGNGNFLFRTKDYRRHSELKKAADETNKLLRQQLEQQRQQTPAPGPGAYLASDGRYYTTDGRFMWDGQAWQPR
jgi:hypothetical protein